MKEELEQKIGAVVSYRLGSRPGIRGQIIGADGSGDYARVFLGSPNDAVEKALEHLEGLRQKGHKIEECILVSNDQLDGWKHTRIFVEEA
jgi:hypothetical protein